MTTEASSDVTVLMICEQNFLFRGSLFLLHFHKSHQHQNHTILPPPVISSAASGDLVEGRTSHTPNQDRNEEPAVAVAADEEEEGAVHTAPPLVKDRELKLALSETAATDVSGAAGPAMDKRWT